MDLNKKLIDQLSDLSRNIKSLSSEVKEIKSSSEEENKTKDTGEEKNKEFLKSLESIFKKGVADIVKTNTETNTVKPKEDEDLSKKMKNFSNIFGSLPKFEKGGKMKKEGLAVVGEKGPEVVKLKSGDEVLSNDRYEEILKMSLEERQKNKIDSIELLKAMRYQKQKDELAKSQKAEIKTADQALNPPNKKPSPELTLEEIKKKLVELDPEKYKISPDELDQDAEWEFNNLKTEAEREAEMKERAAEEKKTLDNLSKPVTPAKEPEVTSTEEELSRKEKREKRKGEKKAEKEKAKGADELLKGETKKEEEKKPSLFNKAKEIIGGTGKNLLMTKGKDFLSEKISGKSGKEGESEEDPKKSLLSKGISTATSLLSDKENRGKIMEKIKGLKKKEETTEEKSSMSMESPELKKPPVKAETPKSETSKDETPKPEAPKAEAPKAAAETKTETTTETKGKAPSAKTEGTSTSGGGGMTSEDAQGMISLLSRIASLLEGPLSVETMESPFRPDSRRF